MVGTEAIVRTIMQRTEAESRQLSDTVQERARVLSEVTLARLDQLERTFQSELAERSRVLSEASVARADHVQAALQQEIADLRHRVAVIDHMLRDRPSRSELTAQLNADVVEPVAGRAREAADTAATRALDAAMDSLTSLSRESAVVAERTRGIESALRRAAQVIEAKPGEGLDSTGWEGLAGLSAKLEAIRATAEQQHDYARTAERERQDLMLLLDRLSPVAGGPRYAVETSHQVAEHSDDHRHPLGVAQDHTRSPRFVRACEQALARDGRKLKGLDIGCAGGGVVLDFCLRGHEGVGIEGSDHAQRTQRGAWRLLHDRLFTCDATEPYRITRNGKPARFDVISAWEVLEHIREEQLERFFGNVRDHLGPGGVFCASVATFDCTNPNTGAVYHVTVKPRDWWMERVRSLGFEEASGLFDTGDFARGSGNGLPSFDWDADKRPELGFHLVLRAS